MDLLPTVSGVGLAGGPVNAVLYGSNAGPTPAAGQDFVYTIPDTGGVYEIVAVRARLVTSAAVANRGVVLQVKDAAGTLVYQSEASIAVTASLAIGFTFAETYASGTGDITTTKAMGLPLPLGPFLPRWTIGTATALIDAADQWSQVAVWYRAYYLDASEGAGEAGYDLATNGA